MNLVPMEKSDRVQLLDIFRGIAILGIFLVNVPSMVKVQPADKVRVFEGVDSVIKLLFDLFFTTKFYSIFALLFGAGFWFFMSRAEKHGKNAVQLFLRRSLFLLLIGILHGALLWEGDVLEFYAVHGLGLLLFYKRKPKTILIWAISLMVMFWIIVFAATNSTVLNSVPITVSEPYNELNGYLQHVLERVSVHLPLKWATTVVFLFETLPLFLFGLYIVKTGLLQRVAEWKGKLPKIQWGSLLLAALLSVPILISYMTEKYYSSSPVMPYIILQGKAIMLFYLATIARIYTNTKWKSWLTPFSYAGRMALTNYVAHSVVTILLLALIIKNTAALQLWEIIIYCIAVYSLQIVFSRIWLSRYSQGPLEWLWRKGTYGFRKS